MCFLKKSDSVPVVAFGLFIVVTALLPLYAVLYAADVNDRNLPGIQRGGMLEKLAVLDLDAKYGISKEFAEGLSVIVRDEIHSRGNYEVMSREDLRAVADRTQLLQGMGCDDSGQCLIDFGRAIGTRFMVAGAISKFGATYFLSLRLLDTKGENAGVVRRVNQKCKCQYEDDLIEVARNVSHLLMRPELQQATVQKVQPMVTETSDLQLHPPAMDGVSKHDKPKQQSPSQPEDTIIINNSAKDNSGNFSSSSNKPDPPPLVAEKTKLVTQTTRGGTDPISHVEQLTKMQFIWIDGGCFSMGSNNSEKYSKRDEKPVHEVCVDGFHLAIHEVTQHQYEKVTGKNPSHFAGHESHPVENISWSDTQEFLRQLNQKSTMQFRLPTEAEWEYARRGGRNEAVENDAHEIAWFRENSDGRTHEVGTKKKNQLGLFDLGGNVHEWCGDWYQADYYKSSPGKNPTGPSSGKSRVFRGGSWKDGKWSLRYGYRDKLHPSYRFKGLGFRVAAPAR